MERMKNPIPIAVILFLAVNIFLPAPLTASKTKDGPVGDSLITSIPLEARRQIMKLLGDKDLAVIAGCFYRDLDGNSQYDPGEELSASLLGGPGIDAEGIFVNMYFNCYWFDPVKPGKSYRIRYEQDGVEPVKARINPKAGLNIFHVQVTPTKPLVYVTPHSHFDVEWEKTYEEYLDIEIQNVQQRLDLLQLDPAHSFYNDEECVTRPFVERSGHKYVDMLKQGIVDGMVESKGIIAQNELTMPYGESLIRNITLGERMLSELLGEKIRPKVFSSIDQYGYGYQIPQILKKSGRDYFLALAHGHAHRGYFLLLREFLNQLRGIRAGR